MTGCRETVSDGAGETLRIWHCLAPEGREHIWIQVHGVRYDPGDYGGMST